MSQGEPTQGQAAEQAGVGHWAVTQLRSRPAAASIPVRVARARSEGSEWFEAVAEPVWLGAAG